ncbi:hypothetical protein [uncultured Sphingomonas sp.]|uniref:PIN domain-containing protein n=1 Tax=uncultured Sphingomonas sp. TaxID=158754 RepID=UPI0035CA0581
MGSSNVIGLPRDDTDFEDKCVPLFAGVVGDPNLKRVATSGKNQDGIDLIGARDRDPRQPVGVQCKLKTKGDRLTEKEVRSDVSRALTIRPPLTEIYVATTASDDIEYDKLALTIRQEQLAVGRKVDIQIWGWDELQRRIRRDRDALNAFDPDHSASTNELLSLGARTLETGREGVAAIAVVVDRTADLSAQLTSVAALISGGDPGGRLAIDRLMNEQVDRIRDLLNEGKPRTALPLLERMDEQLAADGSPAIRARVRANIGFAHLRLGDERRAAELLLEAHELNPEDGKAQANRLLALAIRGDPAAAMAAARDLLARDPGNALAAANAYQIASMGLADDPDGFVPVELLDDEQVTINRVTCLRERGGPEWRAAAAEAARRLPGSGVLARFAGEALLERAFEERVQDAEPLAPDDRRSTINDAVALLLPHWEEVRRFENAEQKGWLGVGLNLITAYRALCDLPAAERIAAQVLVIAPDDPDALLAAAHLDIIADREVDALAKASGAPDSPSRTLVMLMALGGTGDWAGVVELATPERRAAVTGIDRELVDAMLLRARFETGAVADAPAEVEATLAPWPRSVNMLVTATDVARRHAPELVAGLLARTIAALGPDTRSSERVMLAELALKRDDYETAILALDGHVSTERHSDALLWLALAFANAPTRPRTHAFVTSLAPELLAQSRYARLAGAAESARGDLPAAERHLRAAIADDPVDLRAHMMLHSVLMRADRGDEAAALVRDFDEQAAEGAPIDLMRLATILRHHGEGARALALGFKVASVNRDDQEVVEAYPALVFFNEQLPAEVSAGGTAAPGCWFDLEGLGGPDASGIVQDGPTPEVLSYAPDHPLSRAVLGRSAGDEVILPQGIGPERRYRVREVTHRYVWLLHDITRSHAARFPESVSMAEMTMQGEDIEPVLDMVRRTSGQGANIVETYGKLALPLEVLAGLNHRSVLAVAELIAQAGGEVRTCVGTSDEREDAGRRALRSKGRGAALDTLTAWCAHLTGLLPALEAHFGHLAIAQSTLDDLLELREKERPNVGREYMTLGFEGEQAVRQIHTPEDTARRIAAFDDGLAALRRHCRVLPVDGSDDHRLAVIVNRDVVRRMLDPVLLSR